jgi:hypothetical protein
MGWITLIIRNTYKLQLSELKNQAKHIDVLDVTIHIAGTTYIMVTPLSYTRTFTLPYF